MIPEPTPTTLPLPSPQHASILAPPDLLNSLLILFGFGFILFFALIRYHLPVETRTWLILLTLAAGLVGYVLYGILALQLAEVELLGNLVRYNTTTHWLTPIVSFLFSLVGGGIGGTILYLRQRGRSIPLRSSATEKEA
jgi:hypothetical protein